MKEDKKTEKMSKEEKKAKKATEKLDKKAKKALKEKSEKPNKFIETIKKKWLINSTKTFLLVVIILAVFYWSKCFNAKIRLNTNRFNRR